MDSGTTDPKTDPPIFLFQYRLSQYNLLSTLSRGQRRVRWRVEKLGRLMEPGRLVYFLRGASDGASSAAIVAIGHIENRPDLSVPDPRVDVVIDALVSPPLTRDKMSSDPVLGQWYHLYHGQSGTNFHLKEDIAERLHALVSPWLEPLGNEG